MNTPMSRDMSADSHVTPSLSPSPSPSPYGRLRLRGFPGIPSSVTAHTSSTVTRREKLSPRARARLSRVPVVTSGNAK